MTAPTSQVTVGAVNVSGYATQNCRIQYQPIGGYTVLRQSDGTGIRQQAWTKTRLVITGDGRAPTALRAISYAAALSVTVPDPEEAGGTQTYTVFAELNEQHDINAGRSSWSLTCEEE